MISNDKALRLAGRLVRVLDRNADSHSAMNFIKDRARERALNVIKAMDVYTKALKIRTKERNEGLSALSTLTDTLRAYIPMASVTYPHLNVNLKNLTGVTPDDTLQMTDAILDHFQTEPDFESNSTAVEFVNAVSGVWEKAMKEWSEYESADFELQTAAENLRNAKALFHEDLGVVRRTLAAIIGRSHTDVRKLTLSSSYTRDPEDPEDPEDPKTPDTPDTPANP